MVLIVSMIKIMTEKKEILATYSQPTCPIFGLHVRLLDLISSAKFYRNLLRGLDSVRGLILTTPIGLRCYH